MPSSKYRLFITVEVEEDISEAFLWYEKQQPGLGIRFEREVMESLSRIQENPFMYQAVEGRQRRGLVSNFPYCIYYVISDDEILVSTVFNTHRDPKHWKKL